MNNISFKGSLTFQDFKTYNLYHVKNKYIRKFIILFCCYSALFYIFAHTYFNIAELLLISLGMSLLAEGVLILIFFRRIGAIFSSSNLIRNEFVYEASEKGVNIKRENFKNFIKWNDFIKVAEFKKVILLYTSLNQALIVPNRFFKNESEYDEVKNIIKEKMPANKVKIK